MHCSMLFAISFLPDLCTLKYKAAATELRTWKGSLISLPKYPCFTVYDRKKTTTTAASSLISPPKYPSITALGLSKFVPGSKTERYQTKEIALRLRVHHSFLLFYPPQPWSQVWILIFETSMRTSSIFFAYSLKMNIVESFIVLLSPQKVLHLFLLNEVKLSPYRKTVKFLTFDNLFSQLRHSRLACSRMTRDEYHVFPPKWRWFSHAHLLVLGKSRFRGRPRLRI